MITYLPPFRFDPAELALWEGDTRVPLTPKAGRLLQCLLEHAGRLVPKDTLMQAVWPSTFVQEENIKVLVREIRQALRDDWRQPRFVRSETGRGYQFVAPIFDKAPLTPPRACGAPFVGRADEYARLAEQWSRARHGERRTVLISGERGSGKTALVERFVRTASIEAPALLVWGQCVERVTAPEPYAPILDALDRLASHPRGREVASVLEHLAPTWFVRLTRLADERARMHLRQEAGDLREPLIRELLAALDSLAAEHSVILVLEDLQWSDVATLDTLVALARRRDPARLLIIATFRTSRGRLDGFRHAIAELVTHPFCLDLSLPRLTEGDIAEYLAARFGPGLSPGLAARLHALTDGTALFVELAAQHVIESPGHEHADGRRGGANHLSDIVIPVSLATALETDIDALGSEERLVLEAVAAIGAEFTLWTASAVMGWEPERLEEPLERLVRSGSLIERSGTASMPDGRMAGSYRFRHVFHQALLAARAPILEQTHRAARLAQALHPDGCPLSFAGHGVVGPPRRFGVFPSVA
jgi:DNA-binding winged helix-turn-helix (wHTH) protein